MPLTKGSISYSRFAVKADKPQAVAEARKSLGRILRTRAFEPIDRKSEDERSAGFVEIENPENTEFSVGDVFRGEYALFSFRVDTLRVSSAALRNELERFEAQFEKQNERKPSRQERNDAKASFRQTLRNRATPSTKVHDISWNMKTHQLQVWAGSRKSVEEIVAALESALALKLVPRGPGAMLKSDIDEKLLGPTAELLGVDGKELNV